CLSDQCLIIYCFKRNRDNTPIFHYIFNCFVWFYQCISSIEIESKGSISCFHSGRKLTAGPEIIFCSWCPPVIRGTVPFHNMLRRCPESPYFFKGSIDCC